MWIKLDQVSYEVKNKKIISDLSLEIKRNDFLTITGPSGSGKSTILKLIADLISPTSGTITFQNKNVNSYDPIQYRRQVSYCFQQPMLFGETVRDNLVFLFQIRKQKFDQEKAIKSLASVDLGTDFLTKKITELSGGEKQRVALIRNLMFKPQVLLLDEITTGLDKESKQIVHDLIQRVHKNDTTIIQVTHDNDEIQQAEKIIEIVEGKISK